MARNWSRWRSRSRAQAEAAVVVAAAVVVELVVVRGALRAVAGLPRRNRNNSGLTSPSDFENGPGYIGRRRREQPEHARGDLLSRSGAMHRNSRAQSFEALRLPICRVQAGFDESRSNRVY